MPLLYQKCHPATVCQHRDVIRKRNAPFNATLWAAFFLWN